MMEKAKCSEKVWHSGAFHPYQCQNKVVVEREGKPYCRIHDPEYIKEKQAKREIERLRNSCQECGIRFEPRWEYCPYCGLSRKGA